MIDLYIKDIVCNTYNGSPMTYSTTGAGMSLGFAVISGVEVADLSSPDPRRKNASITTDRTPTDALLASNKFSDETKKLLAENNILRARLVRFLYHPDKRTTQEMYWLLSHEPLKADLSRYM